MSKKTSEVEKIIESHFSLEGDIIPLNGVSRKKIVQEILSWHIQAVAKEKMELVERIEAKLRDAREYYADNAQYARDNVRWDAVVDALDSIISALKSEEKEEGGG